MKRWFLLFSVLLFIVAASPIAAQETLVSLAESDNIGPYLRAFNGLTLYTFVEDEGCTEACLEAWPPFTIESGTELVAGEGLPGELGTLEREDGIVQVTYAGRPLYFYAEDTQLGDTNGHSVNDTWFVARPATVMMGGNDELGDFLVAGNGMTLYIFTPDHEGESYCYDECFYAWPPLVSREGEALLAGEGVTGELSTFEREDGGIQVMYDGKPLYYFDADEAPGHAFGNADDEVWYVIPAEGGEVVTEAGPGVGVELVAEGLGAPVGLMSAGSDSERLFIVDQSGVIRVWSSEGELLEAPFLDLRDRIVELDAGYDERGLLGLAFHPDYVNNGRFFVYYSAPLRDEAPDGWNHTSVISEFTVSADDANVANPDSERVLLMVDQPQMNHNGGQIAFGPDGYLYIPLGDGGGANDTDEGHTPEIGNGQDITNIWGSILRIDVDNGDPYGIPADNPFLNTEGVPPETYAFGFRNPWGLSFDNDRLYVADAGQELWEEVSIVRSGQNYGWNIKEGAHCFDAENPEEPPSDCPDTGANGEPLIDPVLEIGHDIGNVVVGGHVYHGGGLPDFEGMYLFGVYASVPDEASGVVLAATPGAENELWTFEELNIVNGVDGHLGAYLLAFGRGADGEVYVLTSNSSGPLSDTGKVWRLVPADQAEEMQASEPMATQEAESGTAAESTSEQPAEPAATPEASG